jgi:hypothetical protein
VAELLLLAVDEVPVAGPFTTNTLFRELRAGLNHPACADVSARRDWTGRVACWAI